VRRLRRPIAALACVAVTISSIGVPLPASAVKKSAERFPCEHCACGCSDAETCWRECCCYTNRQKLAWAKRNVVTPPTFVVAAAKREACCTAGESSVCCKIGSERPACCVRRAKPACCQTPAVDERDEARGKFVLLVSALRCRGLSLSVALLPPALPAAPLAESTLPDARAGRVFIAATLYEPPSYDVASPPPDAALL